VIVPVPLAAVTGPIRRTMSTACSGSFDSPPNMVFPGPAVSRLVPSVASWSDSRAWLAAVIPSTETIAATPMPMPSADSTARAGRPTTPVSPARMRSSGPSRPGSGSASITDLRCRR
jgi:hypothetical protein